MLRLIFFVALCTPVLVSSCQTAYYNFWETFGVEKRELLQSNVRDTKDAQEELREEFVDTLDRIRKEYKFEGGKLEETYDRLSADYQRAKTKADTLKSRIDKVETIAEDLFNEWKDEAQEITNKTFQSDSLAKLRRSQKKFAGMLTAMRTVEKRLDPVLTNLNDHVLYLKHNLNAKALDAFKKEFRGVEIEIKSLIDQINRSIQETESFSNTLAAT